MRRHGAFAGLMIVADLDTVEQVKLYAHEHGVEDLRQMVMNRQLAGQRKELVESFLEWHDASEAARERERQADAALLAAERSAAAAERTAEETKKTARWAMLAAIATAAAAIGTCVQAYFQYSGK